MDFIEVLAFGVMGFLGGVLTVFLAINRLENSTFLEDTLNDFLNSLANNEESQKLLYQIGGVIGAGIKGGVGLDLTPKTRGGRFKWQDLAMEIAGQFISKSLQNPSPSPTPPTSPPNMNKDKFFNT